jgi:hypothetical protein
MDLLKYIIGEFSVIRGAPVSFGLSVIAVGLLTFYLMTWGYGRENSYLRTQLDDYKEKLKGATPQEARERIDALEAAARETIGMKWPALTVAEMDHLSTLLAATPKVQIRIMYENQLGKELAENLHSCFRKAGWTDVLLSTGSGFGLGISVGHGAVVDPVRTTVERATKLRLHMHEPLQPETPGTMFIGIGINAV